MDQQNEKDKLIQSTNSSALRNTLYKVKQEQKVKADPDAPVMSAEQALQDESIWEVSEEEEPPQSNIVKPHKEYYEEPASLISEEREMARYMCERAPGVIRDRTLFSKMHTLSKKERKLPSMR